MGNEANKYGLFLLGMVAVVAIVGIVVLLNLGGKKEVTVEETAVMEEKTALAGEAVKMAGSARCEKKCKLTKTGKALTACMNTCKAPKTTVVKNYNLQLGISTLYLPSEAIMAPSDVEYAYAISLSGACIYIEGPEGQTAPDFKVRVKSFDDTGAYDIIDLPVSGLKVSKSCQDLDQFFPGMIKFPKGELSDDYVPLYFELDSESVVQESNEEDNAGMVIAQILY